MTKRPLPPGFEDLSFEKSGAKEVIDQLVAERRKFFDGCVSMQTILKITFRQDLAKDPSPTPYTRICLFVRQPPAGSKGLTVSKDGTETTYNLLDIESIERA